MSKSNKYMREIKPGVWVDIYDIISCFKITDGGFQHALKKICAPGQRGHKTEAEDRKDIAASIKRSNEIFFENDGIARVCPQPPPESSPKIPAPDFAQLILTPLQKETIKIMGDGYFLGSSIGRYHCSESGTNYTAKEFQSAFVELADGSLMMEDPLNIGYYRVRPEYLLWLELEESK